MASTYNPTLSGIGEKIVKRREALGMTATELAIQANLNASTLSLYESGQRKMGVDKLIRIAEVLKVPLSYLQPDELDIYLTFPTEFFPVMEKLKALPIDKQQMMLRMFSAQIDVI